MSNAYVRHLDVLVFYYDILYLTFTCFSIKIDKVLSITELALLFHSGKVRREQRYVSLERYPVRRDCFPKLVALAKLLEDNQKGDRPPRFSLGVGFKPFVKKFLIRLILAW